MKKFQPLFLIVVIALWIPALLLALSIAGCETGSTGLARPIAPGLYATTTNIVVVASQAAQSVLPAPWSTAAEAGGAAVLALLAAWQGVTHSKIRSLTTNNNRQDKKEIL